MAAKPYQMAAKAGGALAHAAGGGGGGAGGAMSLGKTAEAGRPTAYACIGPKCSLPVTRPDELERLLREQRSPSAVG